MACIFSTSQLQKVVRTCGIFKHILVWNATRAHPPLQRAYISALRSHHSLEKHSVSRLSTFSRTWIFFLLAFSSLIFSLLLFSSLRFSASSHLCFSSVQFVGSLTSTFSSFTYLILSYLIISVLSYLSNLIQSDLCNLIQSYLSNMIQSYLSNPFQFNLSNLIYVILSIQSIYLICYLIVYSIFPNLFNLSN